MVAALLETDGALDEKTISICRDRSTDFLENIRHPPSDIDHNIQVTRLVQAVADYALARFGRLERNQRKNIVDNLAPLEYDLEHDPDTVVVAPYDRKRFELLIDLTRRALSKSIR